jgi:AcrR family transcriptional regulator
MATKETKEKILASAKKLFNEKGLGNVRLSMISEDAGISIGNLAYHFRNKEAIVESLTVGVHEDFHEILAMYRTRNDFLDFDIQLEALYYFVIASAFFFNNGFDMKTMFPSIYLMKKECGIKLLNQINSRFKNNVSKGLMKKEPVNGYFLSESHSILSNILLLVSYHELLGNGIPAIQEFKKSIWLKFYPYLTEAGIEEFHTLITPRINIL